MKRLPKICALLALLSCLLFPAQSRANLNAQQDLNFGVLPQGATVTIGPDDSGSGRFEAVVQGPRPCPDPVQLRFTSLPSLLTSAGGDTIEVSFGAGMARVWEEADPSNFEEFDPAGQTATFPVESLPAIVGLGATVTIPPDAPPGLYEAMATLEYTRFAVPQRPGDCVQRVREAEIIISVEIEDQLVVTADVNVIDLGMLLHGMVVEAPADGSGETEPAAFTVTGPRSLDYLLTVTTADLEHETESDTLPLEFTGGLWGTDPEQGDPFDSGQTIDSASHDGGPLYIRCGYRVTVPEGVTQGSYVGELTLSVEVILN